MYDLIILGGGPAGLTATVYAIHKRLETLLISEDLGGKSNYRMHIRGLEGYETINGEEVVRHFQSQVEYLDFARLMDKAVSVDLLANGNGEEYIKVTTESGTAFVTRSLIVATGAAAAYAERPRRAQPAGPGSELLRHQPCAAILGQGNGGSGQRQPGLPRRDRAGDAGQSRLPGVARPAADQLALAGQDSPASTTWLYSKTLRLSPSAARRIWRK